MFGEFSRVGAVATVFCLALSPAVAEKLTVGAKGAVYCKTADDVTKQMVLALGGGKDVVPGCGVLPRGQVIEANDVKKAGGMVGGMGTSPGVLGGAPFAFVALGDDTGGEASGSDPAATAVALAAASPSRDLVRVSATDLETQTHKWVGKVVETKLGCFYADVDEFRCFSGRFRVDFTAIFPPAAQSAIQRDCDTISKSQHRACTAVLRFEYVDYSSMDIPGFVGRVNVVTAKDNVGYIVKR